MGKEKKKKKRIKALNYHHFLFSLSTKKVFFLSAFFQVTQGFPYWMSTERKHIFKSQEKYSHKSHQEVKQSWQKHEGTNTISHEKNELCELKERGKILDNGCNNI